MSEQGADSSAFRVLWTLSLALDAAYVTRGFTDVTALLTLLSCALALSVPAAWSRAIAWSAGIALFLAHSPETTNHGFVLFLGSLGALALRLHTDAPRPGWRRAIAFFVLAIYAAAVLQKLNWTYLTDLDASCAMALPRQLLALPAGIEVLLPALSLLGELAIGVALLVPRARRAALVGGGAFHLVLGLSPLSPIYLFSLTMLALLGSAIDGRPSAALRLGAAAIGWLALGAGLARAGELYAVAYLLPWVAWLAVAAVVLVLSLRSLKIVGLGAPGRGRWAAAALAVATFLNTVPAYTGDRLFNSFDMYSNLETRGGVSNHLFLPSLAGSPRWAEPVGVLASDPPELAVDTARGRRWSRLEIARLMHKGKIVSMVYLEGDEQRVWRRGDPPLDGVSWLDLKLRRQRPYADPPACVDLAD